MHVSGAGREKQFLAFRYSRSERASTFDARREIMKVCCFCLEVGARVMLSRAQMLC